MSFEARGRRERGCLFVDHRSDRTSKGGSLFLSKIETCPKTNIIISPHNFFEIVIHFRYIQTMKSRQFEFESSPATKEIFKDFKKRNEHGHEIRVGQRKLSRPFDVTKALHLTLSLK